VSTAIGHGLVGPERRGKPVLTNRGACLLTIRGLRAWRCLGRSYYIAHTVSKGKQVNIPAPRGGERFDCLLVCLLAARLMGMLVSRRTCKAVTPSDLWDACRDSGKRSLFLITDGFNGGAVLSNGSCTARGPWNRIHSEKGFEIWQSAPLSGASLRNTVCP